VPRPKDRGAPDEVAEIAVAIRRLSTESGISETRLAAEPNLVMHLAPEVPINERLSESIARLDQVISYLPDPIDQRYVLTATLSAHEAAVLGEHGSATFCEDAHQE
jgi:hypothetical protein